MKQLKYYGAMHLKYFMHITLQILCSAAAINALLKVKFVLFGSKANGY